MDDVADWILKGEFNYVVYYRILITFQTIKLRVIHDLKKSGVRDSTHHKFAPSEFFKFKKVIRNHA